MISNSIFRICRTFGRFLTLRYKIYYSNDSAPTTPAVYIVHHQNLRGPLICMTWFSITLSPWVLSVFCNQNECFRQYYNYTFTKRFGIPKIIAAIIAFPLSYFITGLMKIIQAIPVFRGSKDILKTFNQSISALIKGQSLLICPDIDYTDTSSSIGELYLGFLSLEKYYMKQTNKHLAFVPLQISKDKHCIYVGESIYFNECIDFKEERAKVYETIKNEFLRLEGMDLNYFITSNRRFF